MTREGRRGDVPGTARRMAAVTVTVLLAAVFEATLAPLGAQAGRAYFVSVDMEGIGGIGTSAMTNGGGKDYATGRALMTGEVLTVIEAIRAADPAASILVNDSHGDMQNVLHTELPPGVAYIQGNQKPLGMVQGLDGTFAGAIFLGYHARAGDPTGFLAHTGSGAVKGLWIDGVEVGEGGLNAMFAGSYGVPVLVAAGDAAFTAEISALVDAETVATKTAESPATARLLHPEDVSASLRAAVERAMGRLDAYAPLGPPRPTPRRVRIRFSDTLRPHVLEAIPGVRRVDGYTLEFDASDMDAAYRMIRLMYKYVTP